MHTEALDLRYVAIFLVAAGFVVPLLRRLGVSPVLGFLGVGLLIGPYGLARFSDTFPWLSAIVISNPGGVHALAELGVVFLLFTIGIELSLSRLWQMRRAVFGLGGAQVLVTGSVIAAIAAVFGNNPAVAIILGASFALSSTAIVTELLIEKRRIGTQVGQACFATLLFQDLAVLPMLFVVQALSAPTNGSALQSLGIALGQALLAIVLILLIGRAIIRPVFRVIGRTASREMFLAAVLLVIIGTASATQQAGLSMALGAFLVGLLFAETEYRYSVEADIEPFKGLLLALFFVSVGMGVDIVQVAQNPGLIALSVIGLFAIKAAIFYPLARAFGYRPAVALEASLLLGQGGEFAFLIVGLALVSGLMPSATGQFMLIVTGLTMMVTPVVAALARVMATRLEDADTARAATHQEAPQHLNDHVVIAGFGRVGQLLGDMLAHHGVAYIAIDTDAQIVARFRADGAGVMFGNARLPGVLGKMGAGEARALVVTMDNVTAAEEVVASARRHWPELHIYARARDSAHARRLLAKGASYVFPETIEASLQLSESVLVDFGIPEEAVRTRIGDRRQQEWARLTIPSAGSRTEGD